MPAAAGQTARRAADGQLARVAVSHIAHANMTGAQLTNDQVRHALRSRAGTGSGPAAYATPLSWYVPFDSERDDGAWLLPASVHDKLSIEHLAGSLTVEPDRWAGADRDSAQVARALLKDHVTAVRCEVLSVCRRQAALADGTHTWVALSCDPIQVRCERLFGAMPFSAYGWEIQGMARADVDRYAPTRQVTALPAHELRGRRPRTP